MKNKIDRSLSSSFFQMLPDDMYDRIAKNLVPAGERTTVINMKNAKLRSMKWIRAAVAACLLLAVGVFSGIYYVNHIAVDSIVNLDVNPSVEISTNKQDRVIQVTAVNEDAEKILSGMNLKNAELKVAVNAIIGSMVQNGYLAADGGGILVSVHSNDESRAQQVRNMVLEDLDDSFKNNQITPSVLNQTVADDEKAARFAQENKISLGKATFILNLAAKDASLQAGDLAQMSLKEIAAVIAEKKINIRDIVDYDADDSIFEMISDHIEDTDEEHPASSADAPQATVISAAKAKEIALRHAGVDASNAVFVKVEREDDEDVPSYEVNFCVGKTEYDYEIDAQSGAVKSVEKETEEEEIPHPSSSVPHSAAGAADVSEERAKQIALQHAGVSAADVVFEKTEMEQENGNTIYDIEFVKEKTQYEYEIDVATGEILHQTQETED